MAAGSLLVTNLNCSNVVVARWDQNDKTSIVPSAAATLKFLQNVGYKTGDTTRIPCMPCPSDPEQFLIVQMETEAEANRICDDSEKKGFAINSTRIVVNNLLGPDGIRVRDVIDCMRIWYDLFENNELMDLLTGLVRMERPGRSTAAMIGYELICKGMGELVENGEGTVFGSFSSNVRRHGYSDIDINVVSSVSTESPGSDIVRPLQQVMENPKCLTTQRLSRAEFQSYPAQDLIKALYRCVSDHSTFKSKFQMRFVPARTPILTFKMCENGMNILFDVSVNNQAGVDKATLLDQFILKDKSTNSKMKNAVSFILFWFKSNKLMNGAYPEEKTETKTGFNSYIVYQLIIHFVQAFADKDLVFPKAKPENRVVEYDFDLIFSDYTVFLKEFFKYFASFDATNKAIYGKQIIKKVTVEKVHKTQKSPLMIMDPMDYTHNISAKVSEDSIKLLNGLIRNALFILKQKIFRVSLLLRTHQTASVLMQNKDSHTCTTTTQVPAALAAFASVCGVHQEYLTFQLPELVQTSEEFMLLLTRILRFDVSPRHEGPSVNNLYNSMGVIFVILAKSWMGRRNKKRLLKSHLRREPSGIELEVMCSDSFKVEEEPIAELRIAMSDIPETDRKVVYVEMKQGQVADVRDAMHFLIDQFMANNLLEIFQGGIKSIASIPRFNNHSSSSSA